LTLYWYLRKIAGPYVTIIYNVLNALLYCVLAGAMITVSASAVRLPFKIPAQTMWYPQDLRFVLVVLVVGSVVVTLAILGFKKLAQFATVCSPWMFLMFIAGALVTLPALAAAIPEVGQIKSISDFWIVAQKLIWVGPVEGQTDTMTIWHVIAFSWICNLAMHVGLSDLAIFRYARRMSYGLYSAFGMYLGHYLAWVAAGIMGAAAALAMNTSLINLDAGGVAFHALGISGAVAVVIAGWTTSNPTLYRAGLALQVITPNWPRWMVTLIAGTVTTLIACFPFVFTKLLDFVGIYGLLLVPIGIIVFVEHWIFPKIGLSRYWIEKKGSLLNWPALAAWVISIAVAMLIWRLHILHLFFLLVPVWILTVSLYILFSLIAGAKTVYEKPEAVQEEVKESSIYEAVDKTGNPNTALLWITGLFALICLLLCFALPLRVYILGTDGYTDRMASLKNTLFIVTLVYFISGTIWYSIKERGKN
jgi:cytosine permease